MSSADLGDDRSGHTVSQPSPEIETSNVKMSKDREAKGPGKIFTIHKLPASGRTSAESWTAKIENVKNHIIDQGRIVSSSNVWKESWEIIPYREERMIDDSACADENSLSCASNVPGMSTGSADFSLRCLMLNLQLPSSCLVLFGN